MSAKESILNAKECVRMIVDGSKADSREVIARYTATMTLHFIDWLFRTSRYVRHDISYQVLLDNLRCERMQDHPGMLRRFALSSGATPEKRHYEHVREGVMGINQIFEDGDRAGLMGVVFCATLENTSEIFIPDLSSRAKILGCKDFTYIDVHGVADVEHSQALLVISEHEESEYDSRSDCHVKEAVDKAVLLIERIYA